MKNPHKTEDTICAIIAGGALLHGIIIHKMTPTGTIAVPLAFVCAIFFGICAIRHWRHWFN